MRGVWGEKKEREREMKEVEWAGETLTKCPNRWQNTQKLPKMLCQGQFKRDPLLTRQQIGGLPAFSLSLSFGVIRVKGSVDRVPASSLLPFKMHENVQRSN